MQELHPYMNTLVKEHFGDLLVGRKMNMGCGRYHLEGFLNVDLYNSPDVRFDIRKPWPIEPASLDSIYASHVLEHFTGEELFDIYWEMGKALKAGGHLVAVVPYATHSLFWSNPFHKQGFIESTMNHFDKKQFGEGTTSHGQNQGVRMHGWTSVRQFFRLDPAYENGGAPTGKDFDFQAKHYLNVIYELYFAQRRDDE